MAVRHFRRKVRVKEKAALAAHADDSVKPH